MEGRPRERLLRIQNPPALHCLLLMTPASQYEMYLNITYKGVPRLVVKTYKELIGQDLPGSSRLICAVTVFRQGWDPIRADIPLLVDRDIFLQFFPILQPACLHWHPTFVQRHSPQAIGCEVHISLFGQPNLAPMSGRCEASWRGWDAASPAPTLHAQSELFCAPKVFVVHPGKQQPVE